MPHPSLLYCQHIPSSVYLLIFSTTRIRITLLWLIDIFKLAHYRTGTSRVQGPNWLFTTHIWNIWHPRWVCNRWWPWVHHSRYMSTHQGLGSTPPPVVCSPPTLKLQSGNWRQNCRTTYHQKHRPAWQSKHRCPTTHHTPMSEHPWSSHKALTCPVCVWQTYQGLHSYTS